VVLGGSHEDRQFCLIDWVNGPLCRWIGVVLGRFREDTQFCLTDWVQWATV